MKMQRQSLTAYGAPLCQTVTDAPRPQGSEVLVRIARCGVCHSDLHMQDGFFKLGDGKTLDVRAGRTLPFTLGHEIAGVIESAGPDAGTSTGTKVAVYPWIGCGQCAACKAGDENICTAPRHLGVTVDGGFATHVLVPHPRYLIDYAPLSAALCWRADVFGAHRICRAQATVRSCGTRTTSTGRSWRRRSDGAGARARHVWRGPVRGRY